ncbi:MAG: hypothetical protein CMJ25_11505 [Phycisphaerae bacterium]|nr:hypothetical protein [Phycisphaerae bacterium]
MKLDPESASPYGVGNGPIDVYIAKRHARKQTYVMEEARQFASLHMTQRLLERRSKNTLFLWTYLTHNYDIGDDIKLTEVNYRKWCGGNSHAWRDAVDDLLAMGAIERADTSKIRGSVYRRVV